MKAWLTDGSGGFTFEERPDPVPAASEVLVRIQAASVGPRDLRMASQRAGLRVGSDFAGVVEAVAGRAPFKAGDRVVGVVPAGGLAERIAVPAASLCRLADGLDMAAAAACAATGLTALYALDRAGSLLGKRVLVTAAGGAVGMLACQLAQFGGADVLGWTRGDAGAKGPFDFAVDMVGGDTLAAALRELAPGGKLIVVGAASGQPSTIDAATIYQNHVEIVGFGLFPELAAKPAAGGLARLFTLVEQGRLQPPAFELRPAGASPAGATGQRVVMALA